MFDKFHSDLLYELECRLPESKYSAEVPIINSTSTLPSLSLLQALKVVLVLQLCNEGIVGGKLSFSREVLGYWGRDTELFGLIRRHNDCVDAPVSCSSVRMSESPLRCWGECVGELRASRR